MAAETDADTVVNAARTAPMMAKRRLVLVRGVERWDGKGKHSAGALDRLAQYATDPVPSSVMVLVATKINGSRKIMRAAKKQGFLVSCQTLSRRELPGWVKSRAKAIGHPIDHATAEALCELVGPELGPVNDALQRLSLYVGLGEPITEDAITEVVTRVRQDTVWALVDALSARDLRAALAALHDAYEPRDNGLPLLGAIGWRSRQLLKFQAALKSASPGDAAKQSGVPPFKANELARTVRALSARTLESWLLLLAEADLALKGSKRNGLEVLSTMLVDMCAGGRA
jgi:DNA polymerase-3 subunit delta